MSDDAAAPIFTFSPFVSSTMRVEPAWIDYNGHLNMAYYLVLLDRATEEGLALVGLGADYLKERGFSYFTVEAHIAYLRELPVDEAVRVTMQLVDFDEKRVHAYFEIRQLAEGWVSATCEKLFLHVDMAERRARRFPEDIRANLAAMKAEHDHLPRPEALGRSVGLGSRAPRAR